MQSQDIANLVINKLTQEQYDSITPSENELYLITDADIELDSLTDVVLDNITDGQSLVYDETTGKWINGTISANASWGHITGTLSNQTDLNNALSGKANISHSHIVSEITDLSIPSNVSELNNDAGYLSNVTWNDIDNKPETFTPSTHNQASNTINALTGYTKLTEASALSASDSLNTALGKLEKALDGKQGSGSYAAEDHTHVMADITDLNIPTITDTYDSSSSDGMSGKAVASAISSKADVSSLSNYVPTTRTVNGKPLTSNITLTSSDISDLNSTIASAISGKANSSEVYTKSELDGKLSGAMHFKGTVNTVSVLPSESNVVGDMYNVKSTGANYAWDGESWDKLSENTDLSGVVPITRTVNGKALSADITLSASDIGALPSSTVIPSTASDVNALPADTVIPSNTSDLNNDSGFIDSLTSGTGISVSGTTINHSNAITSGTVGTSTATSGSTLSIPYVTYDSQGHITVTGTQTHTVTGFASTSHTHGEYVPTTRKVAGKALSSDITLTYSDVGALSAETSIPSTYSDIGAASESHTHDSSQITSLTSYAIATASANIATSDSLNTALGKLEYKLNNGGGGTITKITVGMLAG